MAKKIESGHITPEEYGERTDLDIREVWRMLEDGRLPAVALCEWGDKPFDYWPINSEVVRALVAGRPVDYDPLYGGIRRIEGDKGLIRVLTSPELTPELYPSKTQANTRKQTHEWKKLAWDIGETWMIKEEEGTGRRPSVVEIAKYVEGELSNKGTTGANGRFLDFETIKREALTGITGKKRGENLRR